VGEEPGTLAQGAASSGTGGDLSYSRGRLARLPDSQCAVPGLSKQGLVLIGLAGQAVHVVVERTGTIGVDPEALEVHDHRVAAVAQEAMDLKVDFTHGRAPGKPAKGGPQT